MAIPYNYTDGVLSPAKIYPTTGGVNVASNNSAWANGSYAEVIASTSAAWVITGVVLNSTDAGNVHYEFDIATGGAGSEVVIATVSGFHGLYGLIELPVPINNVAAGVRVSLRARDNGGFLFSTYNLSLQYYDTPIAGRVTTTVAPMYVAPSAADGVAVSSGAGLWVNGAFTTVVASTAGPIILGAFEIVGFNDGHGTQSQEAEIDIAIGSAGNEVVATTIRPRTNTLVRYTTGQCVLKPVLNAIPFGSRVSARLRSAQTYATNIRIKLHYYQSVADNLSDITTTQAQCFLPPAANGLTLTSGATSWVDGAWVEVSPSLPSSIGITEIALGSSPVNAECEIDIGTGALGEEVVISTVRWSSGFSSDIQINNALLFLIAILVPSRSRLVARVRQAQTTTSYTIAIGYIASPTFTQLTQVSHHAYIPAAAGALVATTATAYTPGSWAVAKTSVDGDIYVTGVDFTSQTNVVLMIDVGIGASGSEQVIGTIRYVGNAATMQWVPFAVPVFVPDGSRLAVRSSRGSAGSESFRVGVTYYGDLDVITPSPPMPEWDVREQRRLRRAPHLSDEMLWHYYSQFQLDINAGDGDQSSGPRYFQLRWSDDGGYTWSNIHQITADRVGQYKFRAMWRRLGRSRDRIFEVTDSNDANSVFLDAFIQVEKGTGA